MTTLTELPHHGNFVLSMDDDGNLSVDNIVIAQSASVLQPGTVLGKVTASGKFAPLTLAASDGSQTFGGVLMGRTDPTLADAPAVALTRAAEVYASGLIWPVGTTGNQIAAALAQAAVALIVAR